MKPPVDYDWESVRKEALNFEMGPDYTREDLKRVQGRLLEMGKVTSDILTEAGVKHTLARGSLLGAVRHKGFIPWDDDLDFYVADDQYDLACEALKDNLPADMIVHDQNNDPIYWVEWSRVRDLSTEVIFDQFANDALYKYHGICIDMYRLRVADSADLGDDFVERNHKLAQTKLERGIIDQAGYEKSLATTEALYQRWFVNHERLGGMVYTDGFCWPLDTVDEFFPVQMVDFENTQLPVPKHPIDVLDRLFQEFKWWTLPPYEERHVHYSKVVFK